MERGVAAAGKGFPSHQFRSIVHQGGAVTSGVADGVVVGIVTNNCVTLAQAKEQRGARQERRRANPFATGK